MGWVGVGVGQPFLALLVVVVVVTALGIPQPGTAALTQALTSTLTPALTPTRTQGKLSPFYSSQPIDMTNRYDPR